MNIVKYERSLKKETKAKNNKDEFIFVSQNEAPELDKPNSPFLLLRLDAASTVPFVSAASLRDFEDKGNRKRISINVNDITNI